MNSTCRKSDDCSLGGNQTELMVMGRRRRPCQGRCHTLALRFQAGMCDQVMSALSPPCEDPPR